MTLLAIESATDMVGVGLVRSGGGEVERVHQGGRAHAELLVPSIEEACAIAGCTIRDVEQIAVDVGPGLFTGLRVGVATAKALAQALGIEVIGVSSLDILAAAAARQFGLDEEGEEEEGAAPVVSVVDARRREVFVALYRFDRMPVDPASVRDDRPHPIDPEELVRLVAELAAEVGRVVVVGDGAVRYHHLLSSIPSADIRTEGLSSPPPLVLAHLALSRLAAGAHPIAPGELLPDYRRPADAKINWEQRTPVRSTAGWK
jgi:tRNA threonylcarbamoyladenosine biosynthesis protein TsaB